MYFCLSHSTDTLIKREKFLVILIHNQLLLAELEVKEFAGRIHLRRREVSKMKLASLSVAPCWWSFSKPHGMMRGVQREV